MPEFKSYKGVTDYRGISRLYFFRLIKCIIDIASLDRRRVRILDFGCGQNRLKQNLGGKVTGYDIIEDLSDTTDWRTESFDVFVANQVFYTFTAEELVKLLTELYQGWPKVELIVGISKQGLLNKIGKFLLGKKGAHDETKLSPDDERRVLTEFCTIEREESVFFLASVYKLRFKSVCRKNCCNR